MNRILYVTKHNPWGQGGGSVASKMYLEAFRKVFNNEIIDLCISDSISPSSIPTCIRNSKNLNLIFVPPRTKISKLISAFTGITHRYQKIVNKLLNEKKYSYCIFDHSSISGTLIDKVAPYIKSVVIHHNFEPDYYKDNTTNPIIRNFILPSVRRAERKSYKSSFLNIFLTNDDLLQFKNEYGETESKNISIGLFEPNDNVKGSIVKSLKLQTPTIVITGSLNNVQNVDGIRYFISDLYPEIPSHYKIIIAGQKPDDDLLKLLSNYSNIEVIPNPPQMKDIIHQGNIFLSPARVGGGIKVRITDGLKAGLPVIAHSVSARGYESYIEKGYFIPFDTPDQFKTALIKVISDIETNKYEPSDIANFYMENSDINKVVNLLEDLLLN